jgi:hypothetical protein
VAEESNVFLSDFSLWHHVLNYWYLPASLKDERGFDREVRAAGLNYFKTKPLPDPAFHGRIEASWERIFDLSIAVRGVTDRPRDRSIQATMWVLPLQAVLDIRWFTAR